MQQPFYRPVLTRTDDYCFCHTSCCQRFHTRSDEDFSHIGSHYATPTPLLVCPVTRPQARDYYPRQLDYLHPSYNMATPAVESYDMAEQYRLASEYQLDYDVRQ